MGTGGEVSSGGVAHVVEAEVSYGGAITSVCLATGVDDTALDGAPLMWPSPADGVVTITPAQLGYLLEGIDWRMPQRTWRPTATG